MLFNFEGTYSQRKCSDYSEEDTPVPIPNTVVKPFSADDTWWEAAWESRTQPVFWSHGQAVKTSPFHGGNPGSSPGGVTIRKGIVRFPFYISDICADVVELTDTQDLGSCA